MIGKGLFPVFERTKVP